MKILSLLFVASLGATMASASPTGGLFPYLYDQHGRKVIEDESNYSDVYWTKLNTKTGKRYTGVGVLEFTFLDDSLPENLGDINAQGCSAAFIKPSKSKSSAPAYVLTAGHCYVSLSGAVAEADQVIVDEPALGRVRFMRFSDAKSYIEVRTKRWVYATLKGVDIAILELDATFGELEKQGVIPLEISESQPTNGEKLTLVGQPESSVPENHRVLHESTCSFAGLVSDYRTVQLGSVKRSVYVDRGRTHQCSQSGGMSGGPLINSSGKIVGVVSYGGAYLQDVVDLNSLNLAQYAGYNVAADSSAVPSCFDREGKVSLTWSRCKLEKPCAAEKFSDNESCQKFQCKMGSGRACFEVAEIYLETGSTKKDEEKVLKQSELACEKGDARGCYAVARVYGEKNTKKDFAGAAKYFDKACEIGLPMGCYMRGAIAVDKLDGKTGESSVSAGVDYVETSCKLGSGLACGVIGDFYTTGTHKKKDVVLGLQYFARACAHSGIDEYCLKAAALLDAERRTIQKQMNGTALEKNNYTEEMINHYLVKGCRLLNRVACDVLMDREKNHLFDSSSASAVFDKSRKYRKYIDKVELNTK